MTSGQALLHYLLKQSLILKRTGGPGVCLTQVLMIYELIQVVWLAPTSQWSFVIRLTLMITEKLQLQDSSYQKPDFLINEVYPMKWEVGSALNESPDVTNLPSVEDARYLFNTVKFHIGQIYRLLDEKTFSANMEEFYQPGVSSAKAKEYPLWFIQFLLVMALGKAFLTQTANKTEPIGSKYFRRALALIPDQGSLWKDSVRAIEILALAALYLFSIDHRESGHSFVSNS
jgi:proline utilization trans-activator